VQTAPSRLTDRAILNAKPQPGRCKISDDFGLYLLVMPKGSKHRRLDYRSLVHATHLRTALTPCTASPTRETNETGA
jgi:hypothetical protein